MPKRTNPTCLDCGLNWSHEAASGRRCFVGRACISKRSRYRHRADDLERQAAANSRRKQTGSSSRRVLQLPIIGYRTPPKIQLILYRDTKESPVHAIAAKVWDDGECVAEVEAQHAIGIHQNKLRETLKQWKAFLQTEYGDQGEVKISSLPVKHCSLCQQAGSDSDAE
ncbi:hypothetical protein [cf. Phormidesmis sp. LEGE 11477]|uniref:hypothetical protein n=1 Tax=cf. Phormidesmis sp. LEGE 11477 TaxID=1828680 RepID=UPI00187F21BA|nr:hypothetical protein [cf. Phormidesmis sp. LEGE 11477]MBE9063476.1 hypothetical protein [cf. Phormidesmis sp. LEGE 11477]